MLTWTSTVAALSPHWPSPTAPRATSAKLNLSMSHPTPADSSASSSLLWGDPLPWPPAGQPVGPAQAEPLSPHRHSLLGRLSTGPRTLTGSTPLCTGETGPGRQGQLSKHRP